MVTLRTQNSILPSTTPKNNSQKDVQESDPSVLISSVEHLTRATQALANAPHVITSKSIGTFNHDYKSLDSGEISLRMSLFTSLI